MRLLFVNQYYWPDCAATAQMLSDLCEHLVRCGHEPHVLCSRGRYADAQGIRRAAPSHEIHQGVHIHRVPTWPGPRRGVGRLAQDLGFHLLAGLKVLTSAWRYDAIVSLTTPPLIGVHGALAHSLRLTRHVLWNMDLYPDIAVAAGVLGPRHPAALVLQALADWSGRQSSAVVALGSCMAERLSRHGVPSTKLRIIPVWSQDLAAPDPAQSHELRLRHDLVGRFVVMYSGNAGQLHTFDTVCAAALALRDDNRFAFVFSGGGRRMAEVQAFAAEHRLTQVRVLPYLPREELPAWLAMGDAHLVTLRAGMQGLALPSKLYGILAAARPVLFVGPSDCDTAATVRQADCGAVLDPDYAPGLIATLRHWADDPDERRVLGARARDAFDRHYHAQRALEQWRSLLESLTATTTPAPRAAAVRMRTK